MNVLMSGCSFSTIRCLLIGSLLLAVTLPFTQAQPNTTSLTPQDLYQGIQKGLFDVIVDVRSLEEWEQGHIQGATHLESLHLADADTAIAFPSDIVGCEYCNIVVYCDIGSRAFEAIQVLQSAGFQGNMYNGMGVSQWTEAGYSLTDEASVVPACHSSSEIGEACKMTWLARGIPALALDLPDTPRSEPLESQFTVLLPEEIDAKTRNGEFGVILDVRTGNDWENTGHLPNSTILEALFESGGSLKGCEMCDIIVYGNTAIEAEQALKALVVAGFGGTLYNGQSVADYENSGYSLVYEPSVVPPCATGDSSSCYDMSEEGQASTSAPSSQPGTASDASQEASAAATTGSLLYATLGWHLLLVFVFVNK
jgi:phage shock protein E